MERLFDLDMQLIADATGMIIAIFVLYLAMSYFLFEPAKKVLQNRQEKIKNELDEAQSSMEDAQRLKAEYEEKLKNIDKEKEEILSEARKNALKNETEIIAKAKEEAARIMERAQAEAMLEKQKLADDVKKEMITVASVMAGKVVAASMNTQIQEQLIDETLKEIGDSTWLS
ncbi:MAG: F0F1 ATP synthase subunit B [Lachnospiraceae bacterium]|nr:F0F1 ATP synthase subunit B [Lachnospiraceae bacterium]